ncbi:MAG: hypothetical protein IKH36_01980 [Bacilli bacterium]|nr:hypothetical protein [Bacilli bacterium]
MNDFIDFDETCIISEKSFKDINNLYKFYPIKSDNTTYYYNKKRKCNVVQKTVDKLLKTTIYLLNKQWYKTELFATNSETLQKVGEVTPELHSILNRYREEKDAEKHRHGSLLDSVIGDLNELLAMDKT